MDIADALVFDPGLSGFELWAGLWVIGNVKVPVTCVNVCACVRNCVRLLRW